VNEQAQAAGNPDADERVAHAAMRGVIAAMAMTGMRSLTVALGLVKETPPRAIVRQTSKGLFRVVPKGQRRAAIELMHWGYGAGGGAMFAMLPEGLRLRRWAGPVYGLVLWLGFELVQAPLMGLEQAKKARPVERVALAVDHLMYGLVLSETRRRARE
jgi:uncharacterized membrane protein YagU involved in acid resistance